MPPSSPSPVTHPCPNCERPVPADALFCPSCGLSAAASLLSDTLVGKGQADEGGTPSYELAPERLAAALGPNYELGRLLGRGGYAEVFTVRDLRLERELAVKVLRPDLILSEQLVIRFRREALAVAGIQHPNIVPVYDVGESEGVLWLLMPLVQGESLKSILAREGHLPVTEARRILLQAAEALQAAHEAGVVHRDIKPENLMIEGKTGRVMLMDFGIAKAMDAGTEHALTGTGVIVGTPKYMSPEQAIGKRAVTAASDQYSLAVVGYQMLSGRVPFEGDNLREVMARQLFDEPIPLSRLIPDIPPELSTTIHQALRKDPARRFASMDAFGRSLRGEPVAPEEGGRVRRRSSKFAIQLRQRGWLAAGLWTVVIAGAAYGAVRAGLFRQDPSGPVPTPPGTATQTAPGSPPAPGPAQRPAPSGPRNAARPNPGGAVAGVDTAGNTAATPAGGIAPATCDDAMQAGEWTAAFQHCEAESEESSAAMRNLGLLYGEGKGVAQNDRLASNYLAMAATTHPAGPDTQAVVLMASRFDEGRGTPADRNRGAGLWELAAEMGVPEAWPIIAQRYANGDGRRKNDQRAAYWYEKAATNGQVPSMLRLAELLDRGQGVRRDEHAAARWYAKAAEARDPEGEYQIAMRLLNGRGGFVKDEVTGLMWLKRAAEHGHSEAIRELARRGEAGG
ncbi:MAG: protein kinase domain-containing protein [Gemmatimonadales bacterium]